MKPIPSEDSIQRAIFDHYRRGRKNAVLMHVPNGGLRSKATAGKLKAQGVQPGAPDLVCCVDGKFYGLELKTERGQVSKHQGELGLRLVDAGGDYKVARGLDQALHYLEQWGVLRSSSAN